MFGWAVVGAAVAIIIGIGGALLGMNPPQYGLAVVSFSVAALLLGARIAWWLATEQDETASTTSLLLLAFLLIGSIGASWAGSLIWVNGLAKRDPLSISFSGTSIPNYSPGTVIAGIPWDPGYADIRTGFENNGSRDILNLDVTLQMDSFSSLFAQIGRVPIMVEYWGMKFGGPTRLLMSNGGVLQSDQMGGDGKTFANCFRLRCDRLINGFPVNLVFASSNPTTNDTIHQTPTGEIVGIRTNPKYLSVTGTYQIETSSGNRRTFVVKKEFGIRPPGTRPQGWQMGTPLH